MRHIVRNCLRGSIILVSGLAIAACSGLSDLPDLIDTGAANGAATGQISGVNAVRMRVAGKAMENGDYGVAARFYQTVADAVPASAEPLLGLGEAELAQGRLAEAESAFRTAVRLSPETAETNDALGRVLVSKGAFLEAIQYFRRALAKAPSAPLHNKLGVAHDLMGDGEAAQRHYRAALELDPETVTARNNLALSLAISERYPEAIAEMERVAARPGATQRHQQNLAFVYGMAGRLEDTGRVLGKTDIPESEQARNQALFERIRALAKAGDRSAVLDFLRSAKPGSSFADQMDQVPEPSAPTTGSVAAAPASDRGLRQDEMAVSAPAASASPTQAGAAGGAEAPAAPAADNDSGKSTPAPKPSKSGITDLARLTSAVQAPESAADSPQSAPSGPQAASQGPYRIQLASYRTEKTAMRGHGMLLAMLGERVTGLEILVRQSRSAAGGIDYRVRTPGLADRVAATGLCTEIVAAGHPDCLVIRHNPALWEAVAAPQPQPAAAAAAQYRIQLASYRTQARAARGRDILSKLLGDQMKALEILVKRSHSAESKSIDFTIRSIPLESREEGARLCDAVRAAGHPGCLVIRHGDAFWQIAGDDPGKRAAAETP